MKIYKMSGEFLSENTYILEEDGQGIIIDPGASCARILDGCRSLKIAPLAVFLTHGHIDHIFGAPGLQQEGLPIYAGEQEFEVIRGKANLALVFGRSLPSFTPDFGVVDGQEVKVGPFVVRVIFTPGHTQGGVCYLINGALFSGDTLFCGSYGRVDLPTGDEQDLLCSITDELFSLPHETPVYAGHSELSTPLNPALCAPDTSIGNEYSTNPILNLL